ncbi:HAMP domain-containing protein, partial [Vibrio parahaemolyticus]
AQNDKLYQTAVEDSNKSFSFAIWTLVVVLLVVLAVIVLVWSGIHHILVRPLNRMIEHIKMIAAGDLTQPIAVTSRNEMGVLAA